MEGLKARWARVARRGKGQARLIALPGEPLANGIEFLDRLRLSKIAQTRKDINHQAAQPSCPLATRHMEVGRARSGKPGIGLVADSL